MAELDKQNKRAESSEKRSLSPSDNGKGERKYVLNSQSREHEKTYRVSGAQRQNNEAQKQSAKAGKMMFAQSTQKSQSKTLASQTSDKRPRSYSEHKAQETAFPFENSNASDKMRKTAYFEQNSPHTNAFAASENKAQTASAFDNPNASDKMRKAAYFEQNNSLKNDLTKNNEGKKNPSNYEDFKNEKRLEKARQLEEKLNENIQINRASVIREEKSEDVPVEHKKEKIAYQYKKLDEKAKGLKGSAFAREARKKVYVSAVEDVLNKKLESGEKITDKELQKIANDIANKYYIDEYSSEKSLLAGKNRSNNYEENVLEMMDIDTEVFKDVIKDFEKSHGKLSFAEKQALDKFNNALKSRQQELISKRRTDLRHSVEVITDIGRGDIGKLAANAVKREVLTENQQIALGNANRIGSAVKNSDSVGGAVMDVGTTLAMIEAKKTVGRILDGKHDDKILNRVKNLVKNNGNRYGIEKFGEVIKNSAKSKRARREERRRQREESNPKLRNTKLKTGNSKKMQEEKKEYVKKQKAKEIKGKRKDMFAKEERKSGNTMFGGSKNLFKRFAKKKSSALVIGAGGIIFTVIYGVVLVVILVAAFFSWITPFSYTLAADKEEKEVKEEKDEINAYCLMLQDYFYVTKAHYYLKYGAYANAYYNWESASGTATWGSYYEEILKPQIEKAVKAIQDNFSKTLSGMKKPDPSYVNSLAKQMAEEIKKVTEQIIEEGKKNYKQIIDNLDDAYSEPKHIDFDPQNKVSPTHDEKNGSHDGSLDVEQYSGKIVDGTNGYDLASLNIPTELSAEELLSYVALANSLSLISEDKQNDETEEAPNDGNENKEDDDKAEETESIRNDDPQITPKEINKFFERTGYIKIEYKTETGECDGCTRKLKGSWTAGWHWEEYCPGGHSILSGQISCLSEDELLQAVMEEYKAKDVGLSEDDCKKIIDEYKEHIKNILADEPERELGESNIDVPAGWYMAYVMSKGKTPIPHGEWVPPQPINLGEDEEADESGEESK